MQTHILNNYFGVKKLKEWRFFDIEGQQDPSLILENWLDGNSLKQESSIDISDSRFMQTHQSGSEIDANSDQTSLNVAVRKGHLEMVKILLEKGAKENKSSDRNQVPKAVAENHGNNGIYDLMLSYENDRKSDRAANSGTNRHRKDSYASSSSSAYPNSVEKPIKSEKRVTIHMNFHKHKVTKNQPAKLIILPDSLEELLKIAGTLS